MPEPETDGAVGVEPPRSHPRPHPDILAAVLDTLARERLTVDPPGLAVLRGMSCRLGDVAGALGDCMLTTLAAPDSTPVPPRPVPGLRRGGPYPTDGVRGPRPVERRPGS